MKHSAEINNQILDLFKSSAEKAENQRKLLRTLIEDCTKPKESLSVYSERSKAIEKDFLNYGTDKCPGLIFSKEIFDFGHYKNHRNFKSKFFFKNEKLEAVLNKLFILERPSMNRLMLIDIEGTFEGKILTFNDILKVSDRDIQRILREVTDDQLAHALLGQSISVKEKFYRNMSIRAAQDLQRKMCRLIRKPDEKQTLKCQNEIIEIFATIIQNKEMFSPKKYEFDFPIW